MTQTHIADIQRQKYSLRTQTLSAVFTCCACLFLWVTATVYVSESVSYSSLRAELAEEALMNLEGEQNTTTTTSVALVTDEQDDSELSVDDEQEKQTDDSVDDVATETEEEQDDDLAPQEETEERVSAEEHSDTFDVAAAKERLLAYGTPFDATKTPVLTSGGIPVVDDPTFTLCIQTELSALTAEFAVDADVDVNEGDSVPQEDNSIKEVDTLLDELDSSIQQELQEEGGDEESSDDELHVNTGWWSNLVANVLSEDAPPQENLQQDDTVSPDEESSSSAADDASSSSAASSSVDSVEVAAVTAEEQETESSSQESSASSSSASSSDATDETILDNSTSSADEEVSNQDNATSLDNEDQSDTEDDADTIVEPDICANHRFEEQSNVFSFPVRDETALLTLIYDEDIQAARTALPQDMVGLPAELFDLWLQIAAHEPDTTDVSDAVTQVEDTTNTADEGDGTADTSGDTQSEEESSPVSRTFAGIVAELATVHQVTFHANTKTLLVDHEDTPITTEPQYTCMKQGNAFDKDGNLYNCNKHHSNGVWDVTYEASKTYEGGVTEVEISTHYRTGERTVTFKDDVIGLQQEAYDLWQEALTFPEAVPVVIVAVSEEEDRTEKLLEEDIQLTQVSNNTFKLLEHATLPTDEHGHLIEEHVITKFIEATTTQEEIDEFVASALVETEEVQEDLSSHALRDQHLLGEVQDAAGITTHRRDMLQPVLEDALEDDEVQQEIVDQLLEHSASEIADIADTIDIDAVIATAIESAEEGDTRKGLLADAGEVIADALDNSLEGEIALQAMTDDIAHNDDIRDEMVQAVQEQGDEGGVATQDASTTVPPPITVTLTPPNGGPPIHLSPDDYHWDHGSVLLVIDPIRRFIPGLYELTVAIHNPITNETTTLTQDFAWGVLALNTHQDSYSVGETADIHIGVLDDEGAIVCDADVTLKITSPRQEVIVLSTADNSIETTGTCGHMQTGFIDPDYRAFFTFAEPGRYELLLNATTEHGERGLREEIEVGAGRPFTITRTSATRLYPVGPAPMTVDILFEQDVEGATITDIVPKEFIISDVSYSVSGQRRTAYTLEEGEDSLFIHLPNIDGAAGEIMQLIYNFDAPDPSPQFFTVGPLQVASATLNAVEQRAWMIANDAPGGVSSNLILWLKADAITGVADGASLTTWSDSANSNDATGGVSPDYRNNATNNLNFNPVVDFNGSSHYLEGTGGFYTHDYFVVARADNAVTSSSNTYHLFGADAPAVGSDITGLTIGSATAGVTDELVTHAVEDSSQWRSAYSTTTDTIATIPYIYNVKDNATTDGTDIFLNGRKVNNVTANTFEQHSNLAYRIGRNHSTSNRYLNGQIAEIIVYSSRNSDADRQKLESYLGLKYGVTLSGGTIDYVSSNSTVVWDASEHLSYSGGIAGIARDDTAELSQLRSRSTAVSAAVTMSGSVASIADMEFMLWGHNGGSLTETTSDVPTGYDRRLNRVWKIDETGDVGSVAVSIDLSSATVSGTARDDFALLVDTDTTFANATVVAVDTFGSNIATVSGTTLLVDGSYFTFATAKSILAPTILQPQNGSATRSTTPSLHGTGSVSGDAITVLSGSTTLCSTTVTSTGAWGCTSGVNLPGGATYTISVAEARNSTSATGTVTFTVDTTPPVITEIAPMSTYNGAMPNYSFSVTETGSITFGSIVVGGSCTTSTTTVSTGSNTITLGPLAAGTYNNCTVAITDSAGNSSNTLQLSQFHVLKQSGGGGGGAAVVEKKNLIRWFIQKPAPVSTSTASTAREEAATQSQLTNLFNTVATVRDEQEERTTRFERQTRLGVLRSAAGKQAVEFIPVLNEKQSVVGYYTKDGELETLVNEDGSLNKEGFLSRTECEDTFSYPVLSSKDESFIALNPRGVPVRFDDVSPKQSFAKALSILVKLGIISGYRNPDGSPSGLFGPQDSISRAAFITALVRAANLPLSDDFSSVPDPNHWSAPYVATLQERGEISVSFLAPESLQEPLTKAEAAHLMTIAFSIDTAEASGEIFDDVRGRMKHAEAIEALRFYCIQLELDIGQRSRQRILLRPSAPLKRSEAVELIVRAMARLGFLSDVL